MVDKQEFFFPYHKFRGEPKARAIVFDANLQEFCQRVMLICALENGGKLTSREAYDQIADLWSSLSASKKALLDNPDWHDRLELDENE
ncbi:MAG: hypothetical protein HC926_00405 [Synechococcaceae cyanobacterium SM2_3_60]|nr:hypothetical protein [Synechococcaceae cyanobacterium SM2_3_60]